MRRRPERRQDPAPSIQSLTAPSPDVTPVPGTELSDLGYRMGGVRAAAIVFLGIGGAVLAQNGFHLVSGPGGPRL